MMNSHSAAQAVVYSVIENVRASAVTRDELMKALSSGAGDSTVVRTLFGDVSLLTILRLAIEFWDIRPGRGPSLCERTTVLRRPQSSIGRVRRQVRP
jgi:hypothetical protein